MSTIVERIAQLAKGLLISLCLVSLPASAVPLVSVEPSLSTASIGNFVDVSVNIMSPMDIFAYQFDVNFDPEILSAISAEEGRFLAVGGPTFFIPGAVDNLSGTISFIANTLIGNAPGVSGDGVLAIVRFEVLAIGVTAIDLSGILLLDPSLTEIAHKAVGGTVSAVPEPSTLVLFATAMFVLLCVSGRRAMITRRSDHEHLLDQCV